MKKEGKEAHLAIWSYRHEKRRKTMKRFQKIIAMALAATLAVPGSVLSTFASARVEEGKSFFTSFENDEEWSDNFKANTLEVVDGKGKAQNRCV